MFVSAAVSELHESNQNKEKEKEEEKKNSEIGYSQFNSFPGYIIHPFFNQRYLLSPCVHSMCYKSRTPQTESDHEDFL